MSNQIKVFTLFDLDLVHVTVFDQSMSSQAEQRRAHFSLRVDSWLSFLDWFLRSSRESNERFLGAAIVISRPVICQV